MVERKTEFRTKIAERAWDFLQNLYGFELSEQSQNNVNKLNNYLKTGTGVVYINHTAFIDAPVIISLVLSQLTNAKQILGPVAMKRYDFKRDPVTAVLFRSLKLLNIQPFPVVQVNDEVDYGIERRKMLDNLKTESKKIFSLPGSVYGIALEGTRNRKDGTLQRANRGIGYLEQYGWDNIYYFPTVILTKKHSEQFTVSAGEPLELRQILPEDIYLPIDKKDRAQTIADFHSLRMAELMLERLRGVY